MCEKHRGATNGGIKSALDAMMMGCSLKNVASEFSINKKILQRHRDKSKGSWWFVSGWKISCF